MFHHKSSTNSTNYGFNGFKTTEMIIFGGKMEKGSAFGCFCTCFLGHFESRTKHLPPLPATQITKAYPNILCQNSMNNLFPLRFSGITNCSPRIRYYYCKWESINLPCEYYLIFQAIPSTCHVLSTIFHQGAGFSNSSY